jgi:hypothetical protein
MVNLPKQIKTNILFKQLQSSKIFQKHSSKHILVNIDKFSNFLDY